MILFLFGFSLCLNFILIFIGFKLYNKFVPVFKSNGINIDYLDSISGFWGDDDV